MSELKSAIVRRLGNARRNKDKTLLAFYQTFLGDIEKVEKDKGKAITDTQINMQAKQWKKNLLVTAANAFENGRDNLHALAQRELVLLRDFLPVYALTGDSLIKVVQSILDNEDKGNLGVVMKTLKINHNGKYDADEAKEITKELIDSERE